MRQWAAYQMKRVLGRVYSIGIYAGSSPLELRASGGVGNPILTRNSMPGLLATFVADPFMIPVDGTWFMFFELMNWRPGCRKGEIALATSRDARTWKYEGIVLAEPFHLSYPYVFEWNSEYYMVPESSAAGSVRLYRAKPFPNRWVLDTILLRGPVHFDNCLFHRSGRWWMLTETDEQLGTLSLFHAPELAGPWTEHPRSPVVRSDLRIARPAGRVVSVSDRLIRFAQDCRSQYGASVSAVEITRLTTTEYEETEIGGNPVLAGSGQGWNQLGMHHVDPHRLEDGSWIACVDGWSNHVRRPREIIRWAADRFYESAP
jgi:hypothetical protein